MYLSWFLQIILFVFRWTLPFDNVTCVYVAEIIFKIVFPLELLLISKVFHCPVIVYYTILLFLTFWVCELFLLFDSMEELR